MVITRTRGKKPEMKKDQNKIGSIRRKNQSNSIQFFIEGMGKENLKLN